MSGKSSANRLAAISPLSALILLLSFSLSGVCFWKAVPRSEADSVPAVAGASVVDAGPRVKAIERIRVGERMVGENPIDELDTSLGTQVDAATWRKLTLRAPKQDGSHADVVLLRPQWWLEQRQARAGGTVYISVPECGIDGNAELLRTDPCPPISPGTGPVVTGTFRHSSADIIDVHISGLSEPIGTTANHPFWSEDRNTFLRADELRIGETLRTRAGPARVLSITKRATPAPVYNLEVHEQHVYHVGTAGVLVHNGNCPDFVKDPGLVGLEDFRAFDNNGWRNADGTFASGSLGGVGRPGQAAVDRVRRGIEAKDGWRVVEDEVSVRDATGQLRRYDLVAQSPGERLVGIEVKSGSAARTAAQTSFDRRLNALDGGLNPVGQNSHLDQIRRSLLIEVP